MKRYLAARLGTLCVILAAGALAASETAVPNLAGRWRPDLERSTSEKALKPAAGDPHVAAPPAPPPGPLHHPVELIEQSGSTIRITLHDPEGEPTNTIVLSTDGKEIYNEISGGALMQASKTRWEGASLVVEWRMERDGKALIWGKDVRTLEGTDTQRLVQDLEDAKSRTHSVIVLRREGAGL